MSSSDGGQTCQSDTDSSVEESDFDTMPDIESDKNVIRTKVPLPDQTLGEGGKKVQQTHLQQNSVSSLFLARENQTSMRAFEIKHKYRLKAILG